MKILKFGLVALLTVQGMSQESYVYAPRQPVVKGVKQMFCTGVQYRDVERYISERECADMNRGGALFFEKNSRGLLQFNTKAFSDKVPYNGNKKNASKAEKYVMDKHPGADWYLIPSIFTHAHAGGKIAHLPGDRIHTVQHELGHLTGLGHAGLYKKNDKGELILDYYGDNQSVMGRYPCGFLTAPQYYHQGWLPEKEVALYQKEGDIFQLKRVNAFNQVGGLAAVIVKDKFFKKPDLFEDNDAEEDEPMAKKPPRARDAFISFAIKCEKCISLHLSNGGGSQRIKTFGKEYYDEDFTGLHIKVLDFKDKQIKISVDFAVKPKEFIQETDIDIDALVAGLK